MPKRETLVTLFSRADEGNKGPFGIPTGEAIQALTIEGYWPIRGLVLEVGTGGARLGVWMNGRGHKLFVLTISDEGLTYIMERINLGQVRKHTSKRKHVTDIEIKLAVSLTGRNWPGEECNQLVEQTYALEEKPFRPKWPGLRAAMISLRGRYSDLQNSEIASALISVEFEAEPAKAQTVVVRRFWHVKRSRTVADLFGEGHNDETQVPE